MPGTDSSDARALAAAPLVPAQSVRWRSNATFQRVLGLTLKATLLSADRGFDMLSLWKIISDPSSTWLDVVQQTNFWLLCFGALASTALSALTLSRHRAAIRQNRPYGWGLALFISAIQLAPIVEMVDKIGDGFCWGIGEEDMLSSVASVVSSPHDGPSSSASMARRSRRQAMAEMKGSRYGENLMRGLRKLTIASLPLILLSAIVHSAWLREIAQEPHAWDADYFTEASALAVGIVCLAMACADVVLYVWVDDAFVRTHKKLVQIHYFIEILMRLPLCLLLHTVHFDKWNPLLFLWMGDVTTSVLLLLMPTLWGWTRRRLSCRHAWSQVASAVIMSQILFFVNITVFDPREAFQFVNAGFYIVKYLEAFIICKMLQWHGGFEFLFLQRLSEFELAAVLLSAAVVWVVVPKMRALQDATTSSEAIPRLSRLLPNGEAPTDLEAARNRSRSQLFGIPQGLSLELGTVGSPQSSSVLVARLRGGQAPRPATQRLDLLGDMLEGLCLLSQSQSSRNRPAVARSTVVDVLWSLVLPWDGEYDDGHGGVVRLETLDVEKGAVLIKRWQKVTENEEGSASSMASEKETEALGVVFQGTVLEVVLNQQEGRKLGSFTGKQILFADGQGTIWTRRKCHSAASSFKSRECDGPAPAAAREVLRLVLTQLLLSLRWEPTHLGLGPSTASSGALVAIDASQRPLLSFLLRYATGTQDLTLLSEIYWSLWCLSEDALDSERITYDKARWVLIKSLAGSIEFWDGARGTRLDHLCPDMERIVSFRKAALRLLTQQASLWQQTLSLADLGGQTAGDTSEKSRAVRNRLLELKKATEEGRHQEYLSEDAYMEEVLQVDPELRSATAAASLVSGAATTFLSAPVDPSVPFLGVDISSCEILASNAAPLLLVCWKDTRDAGQDLEANGGGFRRQTSENEVTKYMVKVGDDLRQDQLVLQMLHLMDLVWQERLPPAETRMLRFVPYRVLAMTPSAGYIKFVPGAVSLSKALAQSNGDLMVWLTANRPYERSLDEVLANLCGSAAAYCVATYVLGIGDRHLDNLQITPEGHFFHIDFGFIFGEDPKPFAPRLRLPQQIASVLMAVSDAESGGTLLDRCFLLAGRAYIALRRSMPLWVSLLRVTGQAGGAGCAGLRADANSAVVVVTDRLRSDLGSHGEEEAASEFLMVLTESTEALYPVLTDKVHQLGLFWK